MHWDDKLHFVFIMQFVCYAMAMLGRILLVFNIKCTMRQCWHYFVHFVIIFNNENIYHKILNCHCAPRQRVIALLCFVFSSLDCDMKVLTLERVRVWDDSGKYFAIFSPKIIVLFVTNCDHDLSYDPAVFLYSPMRSQWYLRVIASFYRVNHAQSKHSLSDIHIMSRKAEEICFVLILHSIE